MGPALSHDCLFKPGIGKGTYLSADLSGQSGLRLDAYGAGMANRDVLPTTYFTKVRRATAGVV